MLEAGGLVAFPTETVYGLGASALDARAVLSIFEAKGRPATHPLIAHVTDGAAARALVGGWPERAERLARAFWPGPLTLVVPRGERIPAVVGGGGDSVAVRAPANRVARALLARVAFPIAAPSANRYQSISPTRAEHVVKSLGDRVDLVIDGGACEKGIESTVVDVRGPRARVLRPGALGVEALRAVEPDVETVAAAPEPAEVHLSPGMDARHYAPRARLVLVETRDGAVREARDRARDARVGLVVRGAVDGANAEIDVRRLADDPEAFAASLFATLHALDDAGVDVIVVEAVPPGEAWWAVADRLQRGATNIPS